MSKIFKQFGEALLKNSNWIRKLFSDQTPGKRIVPPRAGDNDSRYQVRLDAGEVVDGIKTVYLQPNSQAKNKSLKKFISKHGTHANLAKAAIDMSTPVEKQKEVAKNFWADATGQATEKVG